MENSKSVTPAPIERCESCFTEIRNDDIYCANCGYPVRGTALEQKTFISKKNIANFDLVAFKKRINKAGNTLFCLAGIFLLGGLINFFSMKDDPNVLAVVVPSLMLAVLFLLLGEYSKKKTLACFISGLCLFIIVQLLNILNDPKIDFLYIILIVVIIVFLVMGIKSAIDIEKIKKEHNIA
jgi:hypothetical protein